MRGISSHVKGESRKLIAEESKKPAPIAKLMEGLEKNGRVISLVYPILLKGIEDLDTDEGTKAALRGRLIETESSSTYVPPIHVPPPKSE